jgi:hypothetical protein
MAEIDQTESRDTAVDIGPDESGFDFSEIGQHVGFDWAPEPHYLKDDVWVPEEFEDDPSNPRDISPLSEDAREALLALDYILSKADIAPRRIEIEQAWKANHYQRGYQFLLKHRNGGWTIPATGTGYGAGEQKYNSQFYSTNIYGEKAEIIIAALAREVPKVEFFPANPEHGPDQDMADVAEDLKDIWSKNNDLQRILRDVAGVFYTEDRALLWTRYEINGDEYGYEEPGEPVVPEDEQNPPTEGTGTSGSDQYDESNQSPVDSTAKRRPRGRVRTTVSGKLDHKVPIYVDSQYLMGGIQIYEDKDVATAKAQFPWMKDKIVGGGDGTGETELDRIARENVRQAVPGQYVTGDSINRHSVVKHTYIRRSMFYDSEVKEEVRTELLDKFPDGVVLVKSATEFCYARNENMDDHIAIGHPFPGKGQNRRALGESLLPIQDYLNELIALALDFAKRTVAKKWMDSEAFNVEALKQQNNVPGSIGPFQRQPGVPVDQLIFIEPTPAPQPWLLTYIQWIITSLSERISGALPSMFGAQISGQVGSEGVAIQRDQALQRVGCPWNEIQAMFACAARQAAMLTAKCANKDINDVIPGKGRVSIKLNSLKGSVLCYPESNPEFPESWSQREQRVMSLVDHALASPNTEYSQIVLSPQNLKILKGVVRMPDFVIKGAASVDKQEAELELLLRLGPVPNPQKTQAEQALQDAQQGMAAIAMKVASGAILSPEEQQQAQQAGPMMSQLQQQIQSMPDLVPTIRAAQDASEDHDTQADVLFNWMNGPNGRKFHYGNPQQQAAYENVHLLWAEHTDVSQKLKAAAAPQPVPKPPSISINAAQMPPEVQDGIVKMAQIPAEVKPSTFADHATREMNRDMAAKIIPDTLYTSQLHKPTPGAEGAGPTEQNPARKLRK